MRNIKSWRPTWRAPAGALTLLVLMTGTALAADPNSMTYYFSSHPMISGTVVTVNDHQMVVNTDQGEQVTLELDTRTMAPRDLAPGMVMRADFNALEDCRLYAVRIMPVRGTASTERLQAYANSHDSPEVIARNATATGGQYWTGQSQAVGTGTRVTAPQAMSEHSTGMTMTATPSTRDYIHSTRPMISGRVVTVNDHRLIVRTDQGQRVGMVMDSRTLLPAAVGPGTFVRAEFERLKDGRYYAKAASLAGSEVAEREQAYAHTIDSETLLAQNVPDCGAVYAGPGTAVTSAVPARDTRVSQETIAARTDPEPTGEESRTLPQTAGAQPLLLLLGALSVVAAGALEVVRRLRSA